MTTLSSAPGNSRSLLATPTIEVICSWPGSKKACLKCKSASHSSSNCPQSGPKVGASLDPEKILAQPPNVTQAAQKGLEVSKGVSGILGVSLADCSKPPPTVPPADTGLAMP